MQSTNTLRKLPTRMGFAVMLACSIGLTACGLANPPGLSPEIGQAPAVQQKIGAVRLSFKSTSYEALATKADVKNIRVTLSGGSLTTPVVKLVPYPLTGDISFEGIAPGSYTMKVEALNAAGTGIGQVIKTVDVVAGQLTSVNVQLKLVPTQVSPGSPGGVKVGIIIEDGDVVTAPLPSPSPTPTPVPTPAPTATPAPTPTPGSSAYGPSSSYVPTYDVKVAAGTVLNQTLLNQYADGTRIALEAGTYRITGALSPKARQQILGFPGAVISGSKLLSGWKQDGTRWYVEGQTQRLAGNTGEIIGGNTMAGKSEDVFYDDKPLKQVDSLASVAPGKFFFDYTNSRIYMADDPNGHKVETTVTAQAFKGGGASVVLKNLVIEKFGNAGQVPAITNNAQTGWVMENCDVRYNHGWGVQLGDGGTVRGSRIRYQGQLGIGGGGNMLVENNEIAYNNSEGFNAGWEAGGSKWVYANGLTVRKNWVHHNYGPGLWTDIQNRNVIFEDNLVEANDKMGIMHEISWNAIIRNNTVRGNGVRYATWEPDGAGIVISTSSDVEVVGNTVEDNVAGVVMIHSPDRSGYDTKNNYVHGNTIKTRKGYSGIVIAGSGGDAAFTTNNNRFADNKYYTTSTSDKRWMWKGALRTFSEWKGFGQDTAGSVTTY